MTLLRFKNFFSIWAVLILSATLALTGCTASLTRETAAEAHPQTPASGASRVSEQNEPQPIPALEDLAQNAATSLTTQHSVPDIDLFELDDFLKALLDREIKPIRGRQERFQQLHDLFYETWSYNLRYYEHLTLNAKDTFYAGGGNCISLSSLFIAAARYVGLKAKFQAVAVERDWFVREGYFEIPGHVNVIVYLGRSQATVEFNQSFFDQHPNKRFKRKIISDQQARAQFYNNLGVDKFSEKKHIEALAYFDKALQFHAKTDFIWSNRGVVLSRLNQIEAAEQSYLRALEIDGRNPSTIRNIYLFYRNLGDTTKQAIYSEKAERYAQKNPWSLATEAETQFKDKQYTKALALIDKAIKIKPDNSEFHLLKARIFLRQGDTKRAQIAKIKALEYAQTEDEKQRIDKELTSVPNEK